MMGDKRLYSQNSENESDVSSDEDLVPNAGNDAMLGGLRWGMTSIRRNARKELGKCDKEEDRNELKDRLESATLGLIKSEKMFLETSRIVAGVVDDLVSDHEVPLSDEEDENGNLRITVCRNNTRHNDDKIKPKLPSAFELLNAQSKMAELFDYRMQNYAESITNEILLDHPQYVALQKQITLGEEDFNRNQALIVEEIDKSNIYYPPEDLYEDESVLPWKDPLTKKPMWNPCKNKFCKHIFEKSSIIDYIEKNLGARCPMYDCQNSRPLEMDHLVIDHELTQSIRRKIAQ